MRLLKALLATVALLLLIPASTLAYRPSLDIAYPASDNRAAYECVYVLFPVDPFSQRCSNWGTLRDSWLRHRCTSEPGGRTYGAWCFEKAYARNNSGSIWWLGIKVTENCATCYGYHTRTYRRYR